MESRRIEELDRIENELSAKLVPCTGKSDTLGGELLRAIERLVYRYYNDGDVVSKGYGIETRLSSYWYLEDTLNRLGVIDVEMNIVGTTSWSEPECDPMTATLTERDYDYSENDKYSDALYRLLEKVIAFVQTDPRAGTPNTDDSRRWREDEVEQIVMQNRENEMYEDEFDPCEEYEEEGWL